MSRKLAGLSGQEVVKALQRAGFDMIRIKGSHHFMRRPGVPNSKVIVPVHGGRDIPPGTVASIVRQAGLTVEEFASLL